jgi:hypothetical protein
MGLFEETHVTALGIILQEGSGALALSDMIDLGSLLSAENSWETAVSLAGF